MSNNDIKAKAQKGGLGESPKCY